MIVPHFSNDVFKSPGQPAVPPCRTVSAADEISGVDISRSFFHVMLAKHGINATELK